MFSKLMEEIRPRLKGSRRSNYEHFNKDENRVLVIGDLHSPFDLDSYFDFCLETYHTGTTVIRWYFIGDIIDSHYSSYHETDADGMGGSDELELAINRLTKMV